MPTAAVLIEDNEAIRNSLSEVLSDVADVEVVNSADTAHHAVMMLIERDLSWKIAIVDIFLKVGSGLSVLEALMNRERDQHVIVFSNYATPDMRARCTQLGADAVFDKSTELDAMLSYCRDQAKLRRTSI